ncbi:hypothetical protein [Nocardiopsis trehalosi]|uniref:hypothetical protein n=1 Tax=Nocardiopsis trehalosi TaxID=109329 RepID=UPI0012FC538C|nr:hypothetical protein [Nocardiopsis trehalosi]
MEWSDAPIPAGNGAAAPLEPQQDGRPDLDEVSQLVDERSIFLLAMAPGVDPSRLVDTVTRHCAQRPVIVVASQPEQVGVISGSGIATGGWIGSLADAARWSPAAAVDGGHTWMVVHRGQPGAAIASYVAVGVHVLASGAQRHTHIARAEALDARGVLAWDPVYAARDPRRFAYPGLPTNPVLHYGRSAPVHDTAIGGAEARGERHTSGGVYDEALYLARQRPLLGWLPLAPVFEPTFEVTPSLRRRDAWACASGAATTARWGHSR